MSRVRRLVWESLAGEKVFSFASYCSYWRIVKVQDILGNFFFEKGFGEVLEAGIFGYSMAKEPGKGDTGGKYEGKSRNDKGFLPGMDLFFEGGKHGGSSLPEGFLLYY